MIVALVQIRMYASRFFEHEHVKALSAEDSKEGEEMWKGTS